MPSRARSMSTGLLCLKRGQCLCYTCHFPRAECIQIQANLLCGTLNSKNAKLKTWSSSLCWSRWLVHLLCSKLFNVYNVESCRDWPSCNLDLFQHTTNYWGPSPSILLIFETSQICILCQVWLPLWLLPISLCCLCQTAKWFIIHPLYRETDTHFIPALWHTQPLYR